MDDDLYDEFGNFMYVWRAKNSLFFFFFPELFLSNSEPRRIKYLEIPIAC